MSAPRLPYDERRPNLTPWARHVVKVRRPVESVRFREMLERLKAKWPWNKPEEPC